MIKILTICKNRRRKRRKRKKDKLLPLSSSPLLLRKQKTLSYSRKTLAPLPRTSRSTSVGIWGRWQAASDLINVRSILQLHFLGRSVTVVEPFGASGSGVRSLFAPGLQLVWRGYFCSFIYAFVWEFVHFICLVVCLFIYWFTNSPLHSFIFSFIYSQN